MVLETPVISPSNHEGYMRYALLLAQQSPPRPTNYRVGALIVDTDKNEILATGFTLELDGNTHAEQCCLMKLSSQHNVPENQLQRILPDNAVLYTTVEPCGLRLSGNLPCVERILRLGTGIKMVYIGLKEPEKFVGENKGRAKLVEAGIGVVLVDGLEDEILKVATAGHKLANVGS